MDVESLKTLLASFHRHQVAYALVGGIALNLHGIVRMTEDIDFFVDPAPANVERLRAALRDLWDDPEIDAIRAEELSGEYPVIRYGPPAGDFAIDIMSGLGTAFAYADIEAEVRDFEGVPVRLATPSTLYRMKRDTVRPLDRADAGSLRRKFRIEDDAGR